MSRIFHWWLAMILFPCFLQGQEYSYTRYDIQHGLAGSMVFCVLKDKQGFLWFGTETGVSRFDGTNFKNFRTAQGLSDNQVLDMFEDSKGRIWMTPFNRSICYYYKGKIYNQLNDPVLKKIVLSGQVLNVAEDKNGTLIIQQRLRIHLLKPDGSLHVITTDPNGPMPYFVGAGTNKAGNFEVAQNNQLFEVQNDSLIYKERLPMPFINYRYMQIRRGVVIFRSGSFDFMYKKDGSFYKVPFDMHSAQKFTVVDDSVVSVNARKGAYLYNTVTKQGEVFLPGESVSAVARDSEQNLWFCTLGHGIFRLNSSNIVNFSLRDKNGSRLGSYFIKKYRDNWLVGADMFRLFELNLQQKEAKLLYGFGEFLPERITNIEFGSDSNLWLGTDSRLVELDRDNKLFRKDILLSVKALSKINNDLYVATDRNVVLVDMVPYQIKDTFWRERSTTVSYFRDTVFVGTLDGLFLVSKDHQVTDKGRIFPQLRGRIMDIRQGKDSTLWIATYSGIFGYKNGSIVAGITEQQGLVSNICRTLGLYDNELWVGTNKGLQKIDISDPAHPQAGYMLSTELVSQIINYVAADSVHVAVATDEGVSIFNKHRMSFNSGAMLYMDNITVSGRHMTWNGQPFHLANKDNNIRFEYAGISYRSGGDMRYDYRLVGLDSAWKQTRENYLTYPTLPGGDYVLQLQVTNKFGLKSGILSVPFSIENKLWQKAWFQVLVTVISVSLVWLLLTWRIRVIRRQESEKNNTRRKIAALEQLALKSQMNPHFIFNSLNSIQHYVMDKDIEGANRFITGFSRLIRQTLDISTRTEISLGEETSYLSTYLQLEKIRLESKFTFEITTDPAIDPDKVFIPPMILQPFVENCVRHGIRYRHDNEGRITIAFKKAGNSLDCEIEDNGIGRKLALTHKSKNPIEYQSKGISLTTDRIELMNKHLARPITIHIYDMEDENGVGTGTRVIISFPLQSTDYIEP